MCHARGVQVLLDGAQSIPHQRVDAQALGVDYLAFSLHKMCGPSGVGALYVRREHYAQMDNFLVGGDTIRDTWADRPPEFLPPPYKYEAGLQDYGGRIGAGAAVEYLEKLDMDAIHRHEMGLNRCLTEGLSKYEELELIGPADPARRGSIVCFFTKKPGLGLLGDMLDERANIMVRSGMFCVNSWFNARRISRNVTAVRASLYLYNTLDECKTFVETVGEILADPMFEGLPILPVREG
jgi:cysteine desulfurase/selenocysteine lyase